MEMTEMERTCEEIEKENQEYLAVFEEELKKKGLSEKTIRRHLENADFYLNTFLLRYDPCPMASGVERLSEFADFFIRKCMWSTPSSVKTTFASLKKFYKCMLEHGNVSPEEFETLKEDIQFNLEDWQEECRVYNEKGYEEYQNMFYGGY